VAQLLKNVVCNHAVPCSIQEGGEGVQGASYTRHCARSDGSITPLPSSYRLAR
jgi:hypothetical protein